MHSELETANKDIESLKDELARTREELETTKDLASREESWTKQSISDEVSKINGLCKVMMKNMGLNYRLMHLYLVLGFSWT